MSNVIGMLGRRFRQHRVLTTAAVIAAALGVGVVASALAHGGHARKSKVNFSVLRHSSTQAKAAVNEPGIPDGAKLAATSNSGGVTTEVFLAELTNGEVCLTDLQVGKGAATACGRPAEVEKNGVEVGLDGPNTMRSMVVLAPDGVASATATDAGGSSHAEQVTNNIVVVTDPSLASVSYTLPNGAVKEFRVPPN